MRLMVLGAFKRVADRTLLPAREVLMRHMTLGALSPVRAYYNPAAAVRLNAPYGAWYFLTFSYWNNTDRDENVS